jgi:hypothetical protein
MDDREEHAYYHPGGVPVTPQAVHFGYEFPVHVSTSVWTAYCMTQGIPSRHDVSQAGLITWLLRSCYDGMTKRLAKNDDFVFYEFYHWYWRRNQPAAKKMKKVRLGARLFLDPSTEGPWMYIFDPRVDTIDKLERGQPGETPESDHIGPPEIYK